MKEIIIPYKLITAYLDGITFYFAEEHKREFGPDDRIPVAYYRHGEHMLKVHPEARILELALLHIQSHPELPTGDLTNTEMEWSDASIRLVIAEVLRHWFPVHDPKLLVMLPRVELTNIGLNEWSDSIKHEIVLEIQRAGIRIGWQDEA